MKKSVGVWERKQWFSHAHILEADGPKIEREKTMWKSEKTSRSAYPFF